MNTTRAETAATPPSRYARWALAAFAVAVIAVGAHTDAAGAASDSSAVALGGSPLTVYVGPRGQCQSSYTVNGQVQGNFYPGGESNFSPVGDCGFFLAFPKGGAGQPALLEGKTFGFEGHAGPLLASSAYTPVEQSPVSGDGSSASPYTQTTTFAVIDSGEKSYASITETTTYVNGAPQFTSTYNVKNVSSGGLFFRAIYAGDLFVNADDRGVGVFLGGPPRFIGGQNAASGVLGGLQELPSPALPWSSFEELAYPDIWNRLAASVEEPEAFHGGVEVL